MNKEQMNETQDLNVDDLSSLVEVEKISKALKNISLDLNGAETKNLVDAKIRIQKLRLILQAQNREMLKNDVNVDGKIFKWLIDIIYNTEKELIKALDVFVMSSKTGRWVRSIKGVGPVLAAGFLSHFDITKVTYAGQFWNYAGLNDNNIKWLGTKKASSIVDNIVGKSKTITDDHLIEISKQTNRPIDKLVKMCVNEKTGKRSKKDLKANLAKLPYNAQLKSLCWLQGGQFMLLKHNKNSLYARIFFERYAWEKIRNDKLIYKDYAYQQLEEYNYDKNTSAYKCLVEGKLSDAHLIARARRYTVKMFISHLFEAMYYFEYNKLPPNPYILSYTEHRDYIEPEVPYIGFEE